MRRLQNCPSHAPPLPPAEPRDLRIRLSPRTHAAHQEHVAVIREQMRPPSRQLHCIGVRVRAHLPHGQIAIALNLHAARLALLHLIEDLVEPGQFFSTPYTRLAPSRPALPEHGGIGSHICLALSNHVRDLSIRRRSEVHAGLHEGVQVGLSPAAKALAQQTVQLFLFFLRQPHPLTAGIRRVLRVLLCQRRQLLNPCFLIELRLTTRETGT